MKVTDPSDRNPLCDMIQPVADALYVLNGRWRLPILMSLIYGNHRFTDIARSIPKMTDRMLSKELRELEINLLINRTVIDAVPVKIEYTITEHGKSLHTVIIELSKWGIYHRQIINKNSRSRKKA
jgi:DNA-binding HxlR family transcriptional regulator